LEQLRTPYSNIRVLQSFRLDLKMPMALVDGLYTLGPKFNFGGFKGAKTGLFGVVTAIRWGGSIKPFGSG
jgi:hypothetical protein